MTPETLQEYVARTGKSQAQVAREIDRTPQALNNMLSRHDLYVVTGMADEILYVGYYGEYYRRIDGRRSA